MYTGCTVVCSEVKKKKIYFWEEIIQNKFLPRSKIKINPRNRTGNKIKSQRLVQENLNMDMNAAKCRYKNAR